VSVTKKLKGKVQVGKGKVKEKAGRTTRDRSLQVAGIGDQVAGDTKLAGENAKDAVRSLKP
jgi:uncharacterized protein YjbJ (UPF0337 family)